jgi:hypothetical protein
MATTDREVLHQQIVDDLEQASTSEDSAPYTYRGLIGIPAARVFRKEAYYDDLQHLFVREVEDGELLEELP